MRADLNTRRIQRRAELEDPWYTPQKLAFLLSQYGPYRRGLAFARPSDGKDALIAKILDQELPLDE